MRRTVSQDSIGNINRKVIQIRRAIHQYPELSFQEFQTSALVSRTLKSARVPFKRLSPTGIVGHIVGRKKGGKIPCVALRADMDALPLDEKAKVPYRSRRRDVMHACGHDAHTAMLLGAAMILAREKNNFSGTVKLIFQPGEEGAGGARRMIKEKALINPSPAAVFGMHVNPRLPTGTIGLRSGPLMAAVDFFSVEVIGEGGHGAYPHEGCDAIVVASHIVMAIQSIASRMVDPVEPVVVTVGLIRGGERYNILPGRVALEGTVRTLSEKLHREMPRVLQRLIKETARAHGARINFRYEILTRVLNNDPAMVELGRRVARKIVGESRLISLDRPSMGGEDFSEYLRQKPGAFFYLGTGNHRLKTDVPWHHPGFSLDERAISTGVRFSAALAKEALKQI